MRSAVLFLVFNRPEPTRQVFQSLRAARPPRLYVAADGARAGRPAEALLCEETRSVASAVDWPCRVEYLFRDENLGCKRAVSSALDWFFGHEEEGIILEDDCVPVPSFFAFCDELLERYRTDERVAMISGDNFQFGQRFGNTSYYFSRYAHIWGWASWRRTWKHYDRDLRFWPAFQAASGLQSVGGLSVAEQRYWREKLDAVAAGAIDTWDFQLQAAMWQQRMLAILPQVNLISNVGFGEQATHTTGASRFANMATQEMSFPMTHPSSVAANAAADAHTSREMYCPPMHRRAMARLRRMLDRVRQV